MGPNPALTINVRPVNSSLLPQQSPQQNHQNSGILNILWNIRAIVSLERYLKYGLRK